MRQSEPKKYGKKYATWRKVRAVWVTSNPPNHEGYYVCGICGKSVHTDDMELDHINPRSRQPQSLGDLQNLHPTHSICNRRKGSRIITPAISSSEYELRKILNL